MEWLGEMLGGTVFAILVAIQILTWIWALIDIVNNRHLNYKEQLFWIVLVFVLPFLGTLIYFLMKKKKK